MLWDDPWKRITMVTARKPQQVSNNEGTIAQLFLLLTHILIESRVVNALHGDSSKGSVPFDVHIVAESSFRSGSFGNVNFRQQ